MTALCDEMDRLHRRNFVAGTKGSLDAFCEHDPGYQKVETAYLAVLAELAQLARDTFGPVEEKVRQAIAGRRSRLLDRADD
jgi:hypothetical protein